MVKQRQRLEANKNKQPGPLGNKFPTNQACNPQKPMEPEQGRPRQGLAQQNPQGIKSHI